MAGTAISIDARAPSDFNRPALVPHPLTRGAVKREHGNGEAVKADAATGLPPQL